METSPPDTFRGLPLTREQDSEIRHFIHCRKRSGLPWDTPELEAMLADMLDPPEVDEEGAESVSDCMRVERGRGPGWGHGRRRAAAAARDLISEAI